MQPEWQITPQFQAPHPDLNTAHQTPSQVAPSYPVPLNNMDQILWNAYKRKMPILRRNEFPEDFVFGSAASAYQYEGAANEYGRGKSIWDTFTENPGDGRILDYSDGKVAVDFYHRYKEDVQRMKDIGLKAFRFSISWSRVLPDGTRDKVNPAGVKFYRDLIEELLRVGIEPWVTLFHWDVPQALETKYKGFLSKSIVEDFCNYAEFCFEKYGDLVKNWITLNEPWSFCYGGYTTGTLAPGRRTPDLSEIADLIEPSRFYPWVFTLADAKGDSGREPYTVAHHQLLAHATAVKVYRDKYKQSQQGQIGITLVSIWTVPFLDAISPDRNDHEAALRYIDFMFGWFMDPLTKGHYPKRMRHFVPHRLPRFKPEEAALVKGSFDFLGLNYYTSYYSIDNSQTKRLFQHDSYITDTHVINKTERWGWPIGPKDANSWLFCYPQGMKDLLVYIKHNYGDPIIYITENGTAEANKLETLKTLHLDVQRIEYHYGHLKCIKEAIEENHVKVKGYFVWSFLDNFEWASGYTVRFGMEYVDYCDNLKRKPKCSHLWFRKLLNPTFEDPSESE